MDVNDMKIEMYVSLFGHVLEMAAESGYGIKEK